VTLHTATLAAFKALLGRYAAQSDVVVGSPVTQRTHTERHEVVGCFVNTVVLRSDLSGDPAFRELLHRVRETVLGAHDHQDLPFERLVEELRPARDRSRAPLFQVMFAYAPFADREIELPGAVLRQVDPDGDTAQFDLRLLAAEEEDGLRLTLTYDRELFERSTAERVLAHLERLLTAVAARPDDPVSAAPLADHAERERTVRTWNDTSAELPGAPFVDLLIAEQSRKTPGAPAVRDDRTVLSYRELDERANRLAHRLRAAGAGPGDVVGVCLPRRTDLVVALLAVLKSGAAYLPLDPAYPEERTRFLLTDARPVTVVTQRDLMDRAGATGVTPIRMDGEPEDLTACPDTPPNVPRRPGDPAYVIHTSGSTGTPKGVVVSHRNLARSTAARHQYYPELVKSFLLVSSPAFDSSVAGLFWTLTSGGELILPAPGSERDAGQLAGLVDRHAISHLLAVPSLYRAVLEAAGGRNLSALRTVIVAGERLPSGLVAEHHALLSGTQLFNEYGLTECSVWSSVYRCPKNSPEPVPIGHPIANTALYLLDSRMEPVAVGEVGELHVGGDGVAHGYLGRPGLTAERYLPDPFGARPGGRLYRTGDLARYRSDGALVLVGRSDHQITLRGFRIEPEEIEAVALRHPGVRQAAVVAGDGAAGGPVLGVYLVTDGSVPFELGRFRDHVRRYLPGHMVPAACAVVDHLPCLPNGKVDRRALEPIDPAGNGVRQTPTAPRDPLEERLLELWTELFDGADIGVEHNFFDLGGHSLLALRLLARIEDTLGVSLSLSQFFDTPTVADLACHVEAALGGDPPVNPDDPLPTDAPSADEGSDVRP
jgi:amino acid adenylation domain-containing protein